MSSKITVDLGHVQKTLLLPLWGRAMETRKKHPLLIDTAAAAIVDTIDYDLSTIAANMHELTRLAWILRSLFMDRIVKRFLERHPRATIANIGCGLDTTFDRVDNGQCRCFDLDLPDVIDLRRRFIRETGRRSFIARSFLDFAWLDELAVDNGVFFMAAGVFYYFEGEQVRGFLGKLAGTFPGAELACDLCSPLGVKVANKKVIAGGGLDERSRLRWGIADPRELAAWDNRIRLLKVYRYFSRTKRHLNPRHWFTAIVSDLLKIQYLVHLRMAKL